MYLTVYSIMFFKSIVFYFLMQALYVKCAPLSAAGSTGDLALSLSIANTSTALSQLADSIIFPIDDSPLELLIVPLSTAPLSRNAVRDILFHNYLFFANLIDSHGDDVLPPQWDPFKAYVVGAYVDLYSRFRDRPLRYSNVRDVLWGLKEYTVAQGHWVEICFLIRPKLGLGPEATIGAGHLLSQRRIHSFAA